MLSFIVIGRNEGWKLTKCIRSILDAVVVADVRDFEIIYVDSNSTDDSVIRAKEFSCVDVYRITGKCNAAVARNIGAKESKGEVLFFIDGDMEINGGFIREAISDGRLRYGCVTGQLVHVTYDGKGNRLGERYDPPQINPSKSEVLKTSGGVFMITRDAWALVGGMRSKYKRNQDIDLTVRLAKKGIETVRIPHLIARHHTIEYKDQDRLWVTFRQNYYAYPPMLFRDHILVPYSWIRALRHNYTAFILILTSFLSLWPKGAAAGVSFYFLVVLLRVHKTNRDVFIRRNRIIFTLERALFQVIQDVLFWVALIFFFPASIDEKYERV